MAATRYACAMTFEELHGRESSNTVYLAHR